MKAKFSAKSETVYSFWLKICRDVNLSMRILWRCKMFFFSKCDSLDFSTQKLTLCQLIHSNFDTLLSLKFNFRLLKKHEKCKICYFHWLYVVEKCLLHRMVFYKIWMSAKTLVWNLTQRKIFHSKSDAL